MAVQASSGLRFPRSKVALAFALAFALQRPMVKIAVVKIALALHIPARRLL